MGWILNSFVSTGFSRSSKGFLNFARIVALISVMLGSMALIISLAVLEGFEFFLYKNVEKFTTHVQIRAFNSQPLERNDKLKSLKDNFHQIEKMAYFVQREGLIRSKDYVEGIFITGIDKSNDIAGIENYLKQGVSKLSSLRSNEIILGKRLADKLKVRIGDNVVLYAIASNYSGGIPNSNINKFKLVGIYESGMAKFDDLYVYVSVATACNFLDIPENYFTSVQIISNDIKSSPKLADDINNYLNYPYYAFSTIQLYSEVFNWIELQKAPIPIVLGLISIVAVMNIVTVLLITVVEKTSSIGVLRAIGMNKRSIISIFVLQGTSIGFIGTIIGCLIAYLFGIIQQNYGLISLNGDIYYLDSLPIKFNLWHFQVVIAMSVVMSFIATFIPSLIASGITPLKAIRYR